MYSFKPRYCFHHWWVIIDSQKRLRKSQKMDYYHCWRAWNRPRKDSQYVSPSYFGQFLAYGSIFESIKVPLKSLLCNFLVSRGAIWDSPRYSTSKIRLIRKLLLIESIIWDRWVEIHALAKLWTTFIGNVLKFKNMTHLFETNRCSKRKNN